mmetsp:Transcript_12129/g.28777  ORF Transcript_12129/g.28777 Transcript_12129/m.28777 type:complete len:498 (+) Transcript_12129:97-1590(+)|eukprot:CAMPEP_0197186940 /NCGR_PEP_ID=MMETSP1423-20130617/14904_1 /TAXON_ID=476441 /ORGANISM="Pseudo-nitzschia heimii, Strain UNC1101" /LENGTH=497 /DNA_ID=CAMNT_0042638385 /DNA_START=70 /DNA_END=1563 /DNA_ORIENTATION=+
MGGTGRKRPADQMATDGGVPGEEPRPDKKNKSGRRKKDKKRGSKHKDGKKSSTKGKSNKDGSSAGTSLETTATEEGQQMAQVLSTFSRLEQSRFDAFRRAAFPGDAISRYVAHCLIHEQNRPVSAGDAQTRVDGGGLAPDASTVRTKIAGVAGGPTDRDGKAGSRFRHLRPTAHQRRRPVLSELVAPGQAGDITVVVSTLAKEYAQRLVLAARRHATERTQRAKERRRRQSTDDDAEESDDDGEDDDDIAISPDDLLRAHADRQARGLDPGFFLQGSSSKDARAAETSLLLADPEHQQRYDLSRSVVLAAQDEYDKAQREHEGGAAKTAADDDDDADNNGDGDVTMAGTESVPEADDGGKSDGEDEPESEEEEDTSEKAMELFSQHVNRVIARQNGIALVTSDDDDEESSSDGKKKVPEDETRSSSAGSAGPAKKESGDTNDSTAPMDTSSDAVSAVAATDPTTPAAVTSATPEARPEPSAVSADPTKDHDVIIIDD